jgi:hypothetical protein
MYKMIYPTLYKLALVLVVLVHNFAKLAKLMRQRTMLKNFTFFWKLIVILLTRKLKQKSNFVRLVNRL